MLYLVDGYNVTRSDPATRDASSDDQREALVGRMRARGTHMLGHGSIRVVFDGVPGEGRVPVAHPGPVSVTFSRDESADDVIVRLATKATERVVVVTNDRELAHRVRVHGPAGLTVRGADCCFEQAAAAQPREARGRKGRGSVAREAGLPRGAADITRELKELWLNEDER